ncbi:MAG: hypothetical protein WCT04_26785, partial [Planctomycetota bacterium]
MKNAETATGRDRIQLRRPLIEKLASKAKAIGRSTLHACSAPIPNAHADVQLLKSRPIHAQRDVELKVWLRPRLIHFVSGKKLKIGIHSQRLIHRHIRLGFRQMMSTELSTMLDAKTAL